MLSKEKRNWRNFHANYGKNYTLFATQNTLAFLICMLVAICTSYVLPLDHAQRTMNLAKEVKRLRVEIEELGLFLT